MVFKEIAHAQEAIDDILARVAAPTIGGEITVKPTGLTDEEVFAWVTVHDKNASRFRKLLNGDYSEYDGDESRGDFAAASKIGFYSGDPDQVERIMRNSAMYRDKWDTHASYLRERTIQRAMSGLKETFTPSQEPDPTPEEKAERERQEKERKAQEAWPKCQKLAHDSDIPARVYETQQADGQVGEETNSKLMTLVGATRHTGRPMSVMVEGSSSAGKSDIIKRQIKCLPPHFVRELQSMSERALAYMGKDALRDRFLTVFELGGLGGDGKESLEMTKQLLTEGCIKRQIAESTPKGVRGRLIEVEGPTALWTTTTKTIIDHELSTRAFKITADDSPATTRGVLVSIFEEERSPADYEREKALHTWLEAQDNRVTQPFGKALAELLPNSAVRMRRDAARLRDLISAHAILHQATRRRDAKGRIIATFEDYEAVRKLLDNIIGVAAEKSVSPTVRETVELAKELIDENKPVTAYTLKDKLGISREQASRRLGAAKGAGYLKHDENADGKQKVYVLGEALPDEGTVLPSVEELKREVCICASESRREGSGQDHDENCPVITCTLDAHVHTQSEESVFSEEEKADKYEEYSEDATVHTDEPPPSGNQTHTCTVTRTECLTPDLCMHSCAKCAQLTPEQEEGWEAIVVLWELEKGLPISRGQADDWMIVKFWEVEMATGIEKVAKVIEYCNDPYELSPNIWQGRVIREIGVEYDHATIIIAMHQARLKATDSEWASIAIRYLEEDGYFAIPRRLSEIHSEVEFGFDIYVPDYVIADACDEEGIMYEEDYRYVEEERDIADLVREEEMYDGVPPETYA